MIHSDKLAVLMPVYNGGENLSRSIASCSRAGMPGNEYELIVVDNCSTDGATESLPARDANGAPIHVLRNASNIGRVANWNRALDVAIERGFRYVTFLFTGDCWAPGNALPVLFSLMRDFRAEIAFAPFLVMDDKGEVKRCSHRFYVSGRGVVCTPDEFLSRLLESGMFPLGPLQANIYRVSPGRKPIFNEQEPTRTDVEATFEFVRSATRSVLIGPEPFLEWREHAGRFHMSMGPRRTIEDYMLTFQFACRRTQLPVNFGRAKARVVLNSLRLMFTDAHPAEWPLLIAVIAKCALRAPHRMSAIHFAQTLWSRFALGRKLLQFG